MDLQCRLTSRKGTAAHWYFKKLTALAGLEDQPCVFTLFIKSVTHKGLWLLKPVSCLKWPDNRLEPSLNFWTWFGAEVPPLLLRTIHRNRLQIPDAPRCSSRGPVESGHKWNLTYKKTSILFICTLGQKISISNQQIGRNSHLTDLLLSC